MLDLLQYHATDYMFSPSFEKIDSIRRHFDCFPEVEWESYYITIEKTDKGFLFYAEEHEPEELEAAGYKVYSKTLKEAITHFTGFAEFFRDTCLDTLYSND
jgi:hypothetical protein